MTTEAAADATPALFGVLDFSADPDRAILARSEVVVTVNGVRERGTSEVRLDLTPRPRVILDCRFDNAGPLLNVLVNPGAVPHVELDGRRIDVVGAGGKWGSDNVLHAKWCPARQPAQVLGDGETKMRRVRACLFNQSLVEGMDLVHGDWSVAIQTHGDTRANQQVIKEQGIYRPTHTVESARATGGAFRGDEASDMLEALRNFLSFANGGPCILVCPSGNDEDGDEVWTQWSSPYGAESVAFCWSGRLFAEPLIALFPGFMTKWEDEGWRDALCTAIWWYATANNGGALDSGIVSAQIAVERLAYEYCVRERALVSERGFDRLPAADRYRMLLASLAIPLDIGPPLDALESASRSGGRGWADVADALVAIRNQLVHSGKPRARLPSECYTEAWLLAAWVLEASILAVCDFGGEYRNRISGSKERGPWTP